MNKREFQLQELLNGLSVEMPKELYNMKVPDPFGVLDWEEKNNRFYYIVSEIDEMAIDIARVIIQYNVADRNIPVEERKPIVLFIDSPGGLDHVSWCIVDAIESSSTPVWTVNLNMAMSNGLTLLVAGHKRFAMPHSSVMYHSGSAGIMGTKEQVGAAGKFLSDQDKAYEDWFVKRTGIDRKLLRRKSKGTDWYITETDEMIQHGIIHKVIENINELMA